MLKQRAVQDLRLVLLGPRPAGSPRSTFIVEEGSNNAAAAGTVYRAAVLGKKSMSHELGVTN